ncbi:MAG: RNA polymerase-associated protein RapA [Thermoanaerobaculia bacterium]|nr:RNA polymerase-associated protein RapA [Thermoanaerobaculia bacterium]
MDFGGDPRAVRAVVEAHRLGFGHLFNPAFATEISLIDPLPHQRIAVYERMLKQPRLRFLLADDAGAGKTIMAGLYIREMLARRLIRRVLVVPPAGLVGNWQREMRKLFRLPFRIVSGGEARSGNPFTGQGSDLVIISIDTLASERMFGRLREEPVAPYDLVIFDEAHKLSARRDPDGTFRATDRYRLAEALTAVPGLDPEWSLAWSCQHLLLLTATPHMGKEFPWYCLWRLLEPEVLSTEQAFAAYPAEARSRHFIRRVKEEMVRFDGGNIYPERISDTFSYELTAGPDSEQQLYDDTTAYIKAVYNTARILNRSAARLAMSVFQRRLASSTWALIRSFERRIQKLERLIEDIQVGKLTIEQLQAMQRRLDSLRDPLSETSADEEAADPEGSDGDGEPEESKALGGVVAGSLAELQAERDQVRGLLELAQRVLARGDESKFQTLKDLLGDERFRGEKILIFTEHRDTLEFLVRRLEGLGFAGQVASIHGGMDFRERDEQVEMFRKPASDGGAIYMVGTDAAGEGINLQFCWLMVNYDLPWNPARLEQRMGRIHRYGQTHDPVFIFNLVAGKTREGRVMKTLLDKLERIRKELRSDKVFDVIGRLFEGISLRDYMQSILAGGTPEGIAAEIEGRLTKEQVTALEERERRLFGEGGEVKKELPRLIRDLGNETYRRLLPGYVRLFLELAAPLLGIKIEGDLDSVFSMRPLRPGALDPLLALLDDWPASATPRFTLHRPKDLRDAIWLHPGEPYFDMLRSALVAQFEGDSLRGCVMVDPEAERPYLLHLALVPVERRADPAIRMFAQPEVLDVRPVAMAQDSAGALSEVPLERLQLLSERRGIPGVAHELASMSRALTEVAGERGKRMLGDPRAESIRSALSSALDERLDFVSRGYDYQSSEVAIRRVNVSERARAGDQLARAELDRIRERQRSLVSRRDEALAALRREPELIETGDLTFLAHILVVPTVEPTDQKRYDAEVEAIAMRVARAHEEARGATVLDVSTALPARLAGLTDYPGFDLLSKHPEGDRAIEVKGRAGVGDIELTGNEWAKACNLRERYWLYVVFECGGPSPRLLRIRDPFASLLATTKASFVIGPQQLHEAATYGEEEKNE